MVPLAGRYCKNRFRTRHAPKEPRAPQRMGHLVEITLKFRGNSDERGGGTPLGTRRLKTFAATAKLPSVKVARFRAPRYHSRNNEERSKKGSTRDVVSG